MRVQHNIASMNSYRNYNNNTRAINKNLEKLSSGYKINRAGDDAAGLAISEKMRAQITGLAGAQKNAKDGISLVQTAEGALTEVHSMLNRMFELAEQSANGTYSNETDRDQLQKEVNQLRDEIDRIADSTNFNGIKLLDGSLGGAGSSTSTASVSADSIKNIDTHKINAVKDDRTIEIAGADDLPGTWVTGNEYHLDIGLSDGTSLNMTLTAQVNEDGVTSLVGDDGATYGTIAATSGAASAPDETDVANAFVNYLKTTSLNDDYKITVPDPTNAPTKINFVAREAGSVGTTIASVKSYTRTDATAAMGTQAPTETVTINAEGKGDVTAIKATDIKEFNGTNAEVDGVIITINDKKFAIATNDAAAQKLGDDVYYIVKDTNTTTTAAADATEAAGAAKTTLENFATLIENQTGLKVTFTTAGNKLDGADSATKNVFTLEAKTTTSSGGGKGLTLQIGDTAESWNQLGVSVKNVHVSAMKLNSIDISKQGGAQAAMDKIKDAINYVSDVRGTLGAAQNRLEHTINNLSVMQENIQDAESTIRDTDVADEMMKYTKNSILVQSAQAMLAQANQQPQGVLQLLQ